MAQALVCYVFVDIWLPDQLQLQGDISRVLASLADEAPRRETLARCQLAAAFKPDKDTRPRAIQSAMDFLHAELDHLVSSGPSNELYANIEELLNEGMSLWAPVQQSKCRIGAVASICPKDLVREEDFYAEYGQVPEASPGMDVPGPIVCLFPQISTEEQIIFPGKVLWPDQPAVLMARAELENDKIRSQPNGGEKAKLLARRRLSIQQETTVVPQTLPAPACRGPPSTPKITTAKTTQSSVSSGGGVTKGSSSK